MNINEANLLQDSMRGLTASILARKKLEQESQDNELRRQAAESLARQRVQSQNETMRHNLAMEGLAAAKVKSAGVSGGAKINGTIIVTAGDKKMSMGVSGDMDAVNGLVDNITSKLPQGAKVEMFDKPPENRIYPVNITTKNGQKAELGFESKEEALAFIQKADELYKPESMVDVTGQLPTGQGASTKVPMSQVGNVSEVIRPIPEKKDFGSGEVMAGDSKMNVPFNSQESQWKFERDNLEKKILGVAPEAFGPEERQIAKKIKELDALLAASQFGPLVPISTSQVPVPSPGVMQPSAAVGKPSVGQSGNLSDAFKAWKQNKQPK